MDNVYADDPYHKDNVYCDVQDSAVKTYEPPRRPIQAPFVEVLNLNSVPSPQTFDVSESNDKQRNHQKSFTATQVLLIVAVAIFATLSIVFMVMYFRAEGKSKPCDCQNSSIKNMKETSEPCDDQNTSRNHTEEKYKPCDCPNSSKVRMIQQKMDSVVLAVWTQRDVSRNMQQVDMLCSYPT